MTYMLNALVGQVAPPPISKSAGWLEGNSSNLPAINLSQAVPSYLPAPELADHVAACIVDGACESVHRHISASLNLRTALASPHELCVCR